MPRRRATGALSLFVFASSIPVILNHGPWDGMTIWGMSFLRFADSLANHVLLPLGGLLLVVYAGWVWGFDAFRRDLNRGAGSITVPAWWRPLIVWILPPAVVLVMLNGLSLL